MKLSPSVNLINVRQAATVRSDPESATDNLTVFFSLLGSGRVKAAHKMLVKSRSGVNFINV